MAFRARPHFELHTVSVHLRDEVLNNVPLNTKRAALQQKYGNVEVASFDVVRMLGLASANTRLNDRGEWVLAEPISEKDVANAACDLIEYIRAIRDRELLSRRATWYEVHRGNDLRSFQTLIHSRAREKDDFVRQILLIFETSWLTDLSHLLPRSMRC